MRVIFDTDIGDDIDDIWALGVLLANRQVEVALVSVCYAHLQSYKAKVATEMLRRFGRSDIPVAVGREIYSGAPANIPHPSVANLPDKGYPTATQAIKEVLDNSDQLVYVLALGPSTNIADFALQYPEYRDKYRVIAMAGAYKKGYLNQQLPDAEFNVIADVSSANVCYRNTNYTMLPLDVCRAIIVDGEGYQKLLSCGKEICKEILLAYDEWQTNYRGGAIKFDSRVQSSILYDVVAVHYLLNADKYLLVQDKILATEEGKTISGDQGALIDVATEVDLPHLIDFIVDSLTK